MNSRESNHISIHQTLHGYSDGHRLLESSLLLGTKAARAMLVLSDMSGPSMINGFDNYLTGYPLREEGWYALGKTWYAPEMERPGCVWTHTLIIDFSDVPRIKNPWRLLSLFRRPENHLKLTQYTDPIVLQTAQLEGSPFSDSLTFHSVERIVKNALLALYGSPDTPVFLAAETSEKYEDVILAIWNQQWPRLQRSFSFCTGSISNRKLNGSYFDVQVVPWPTYDKTRRELTNAKCVDDAQEDESRFFPEWVVVAANDLFHLNNGKLRRFLWNFGADEKNGREAFSRLAAVFSISKKVGLENILIADVIELISRNFPQKKQGARMKSALLGGPEMAQREFLLPVEEGELLKGLCLTKKYRSFDKKGLGIKSRTQNLWKKERSAAEQLIVELARSSINELGEEFIQGVSKAVNPFDVASLSNRETKLVYELVSRNPGLAVSPVLWDQPRETRGQIIEAILSSKNLKNSVLGDIVTAMISHGVSERVEDLIRLSEKCVVKAVLNWFNVKSEQDDIEPEMPFAWKESLGNRPSLVLDWFASCASANEKSVALLAELLDPNSGEVVEFDIEPWLRLPEESYCRLDKKKLHHTMAFLLALSFNNVGLRGYELVILTFQCVHDAAGRDALEKESWQLLVNLVPSLSRWKNWDKCERLRIALIEKFIFFGWPATYFVKSVKRYNTFINIVRSVRYKKKEREFLRRLADEIQRGVIPTANAYLETLWRYL